MYVMNGTQQMQIVGGLPPTYCFSLITGMRLEINRPIQSRETKDCEHRKPRTETPGWISYNRRPIGLFLPASVVDIDDWDIVDEDKQAGMVCSNGMRTSSCIGTSSLPAFDTTEHRC